MKRLIIVNPTAGGGRGLKLWDQLFPVLQKTIGPFDVQHSTGPGEARRIAAKANDVPLIIAVGGDGTIHEVVNGIMDATPLGTGAKKRQALGIISVGTGGDFIKTLQLPRDPHKQIQILKEGKTKTIDLGLIEYTTAKGKKERRVFVNIADAGLGGEVARRIASSRALFGRKLAYLAATLQSYFLWKPKPIQITTDHPLEINWPERPLAVVIANGQYFGSGMPIAPTADLSDGFFDLIAVGTMGPLKVPWAISLLYKGEMGRLKIVHTDRVRKVSLISQEKVGLDIDGESIGFLPASFEVLPKTLEVITP